MVKAKSFANNLILDHFLQLKNILLRAMSNPNIDLNPAQWSFRGNSSDIAFTFETWKPISEKNAII
jgi:hypothetical protein